MTLSPFREFYDMQSEMYRMFKDMFGNLAPEPRRQLNSVAQWVPAIDVVTEDGDIVVRAELPGMTQEDVDVTFNNGLLTISGERKTEEQKEGSDYYVRERRYGSFRRSLALPEGTDESKIHARYENGVLEVTVEGAAAVEEPKRIQIEGA